MSTQPSSKRRLDVGSLRPTDVILTIDGTEYEIRGDIPIEGMIELMRIHKRLDQISDGDTSEDAVIQSLEAVSQANDMIAGMIRERYPDFVMRQTLGIAEVTGVLGFIVGNPGGPAAEVEEALVTGVPAPTEAEIAQRIHEAIERDRLIREGLIPDEDPTSPSRSDSSTSSSPSASTTSGPPSGGSASPGEPSAPTANGQTGE